MESSCVKWRSPGRLVRNNGITRPSPDRRDASALEVDRAEFTFPPGPETCAKEPPETLASVLELFIAIAERRLLCVEHALTLGHPLPNLHAAPDIGDRVMGAAERAHARQTISGHADEARLK